jgi:hypothetical protein
MKYQSISGFTTVLAADTHVTEGAAVHKLGVFRTGTRTLAAAETGRTTFSTDRQYESKAMPLTGREGL